MNSPIPYPANYGFLPLSLVHVRPLGIFALTDRDDKLFCVHIGDPMYSDYTDLPGLPDYEREKLEWFVGDYQDTMREDVEVGDLLGVDDAHEIVRECIKRYQKHFGKDG